MSVDRRWLLSCEHGAEARRDSESELPRRPRMCATRGRYRQFESRATAGAELECAECGVRGREGFRADYGADDEDVPELELLVLCGACWNREFAE